MRAVRKSSEAVWGARAAFGERSMGCRKGRAGQFVSWSASRTVSRRDSMTGSECSSSASAARCGCAASRVLAAGT